MAFLFPPSQPAQLPTWNMALSKKAQERSQMLTHLLDMVPQGLCERTGRAGPSWGPETQVRGVASRGQGFPEYFRFQQLKRSRWAHPLLLRFHPSALEVSEGDCLRHIATWVADRILRKSPRFSAPPPPWCAYSAETLGLRI